MPDQMIDAIDRRILGVLQSDARVTNVELAERVGLSPSPCHRRVRAIEESGVIRNYVALLDAETLGLGLSVFVEVTLKEKTAATSAAFEAAIVGRDEVMECHTMAGDADYLLRIVAPDIPAFRQFIMHELLAMPSVGSTRSSFSLGQVKYTTALPLAAIP